MQCVIAILILATLAFAQNDCPVKDTKSQPALLNVEMRWVKALDARDQKALGCILASEFKDSGVYGELRDRAEVLADLPKRRDAGQRLDALEPAVLGDVGVVRGVNHLTTPDGKPLVDVRFTDVFVYRDGRWQAISAQETLVQSPGKK